MVEGKNSRPVFYSSNIVNLCVDIWRKEGQCGRLYHQYTAEAVPFLSLYEALDWMDQLYDSLRYPEGLAAFRSFAAGCGSEGCTAFKKGRIVELPGRGEKMQKEIRELDSLEHVIGNRGFAATFIIHVQYRQHYSWQGEITWVDKQQKRYFRSVWELVRLMDSALNPKTVKRQE